MVEEAKAWIQRTEKDGGMAQMIPDRMSSGASHGEKLLFMVLQRLPDDCLVYYEPVVARRHPDFVVIAPQLGLMVIEVKGWYPAEILAADSHEVLVFRRQLERRERHPLRQARDYMFRLMDFCRTHPGFEILLEPSGRHQNRFVFPFGHFAVLSNITSEQLSGHSLAFTRPEDFLAITCTGRSRVVDEIRRSESVDLN
jgi:hypothetical protein